MLITIINKDIRSGQYEFPKPEWTNVSSDAKDLIKVNGFYWPRQKTKDKNLTITVI